MGVVCIVSPSVVRAQGTTRYVYDDNGRLHAVISPSGEASVWEYDAAGNFTAIRRLTADDLELLSFSPHEGVPGDLVTFTGVGFNAGVSAVSFNGTLSTNVQITPPIVVAEVPQGATTGLITLTTPHGSVTTPVPFTIGGIRVTPASVSLLSRNTVQFSATVMLSGDQSVTWSVNGTEGGNAAFGTISNTGFYTAPTLSLGQLSARVFVRATSVATPGAFGEAQVTVLNSEFVRLAQSSGVSVRIGNTTTTAPISAVVSVRIGNTTTTAPISAGVSVRIGNTTSSAPTSLAVSVTTAPNIASVAPTQISRGTTVTWVGYGLQKLSKTPPAVRPAWYYRRRNELGNTIEWRCIFNPCPSLTLLYL
jgi:YD repeat-containing protein